MKGTEKSILVYPQENKQIKGHEGRLVSALIFEKEPCYVVSNNMVIAWNRISESYAVLDASKRNLI